MPTLSPSEVLGSKRELRSEKSFPAGEARGEGARRVAFALRYEMCQRSGVEHYLNFAQH
jgi:hypothetical protein